MRAALLVMTMAALLWAGGPWAGASAAAPLAPGVEQPGDRLAAALARTAQAPDDAEAWRQAGLAFHALERFDEAAAAFARVAGAEVDEATALVRLGRMDEARRAVGDSLPLVVRVLLRAGELGRARTVLDAALAQTPEAPDLLREKGRLELTADRPVRAIAPLKRAAALDPAGEAGALLIDAWRTAGMPVRAHQAYGEIVKQAKGAAPPPALIEADLAALVAMRDWRGTDAAARAHLALAPDSRWALKALAVAQDGLGAHAKAAATLRQALALAPPDEAEVDLLVEFAGQGMPHETPEEVMAELRRLHPQAPAVWRRSAAKIGAARRRALADEAVAVAPGLAWPHLDKSRLLGGLGDHAGARAALVVGLARVPASLPGQRALLHARRAQLLARAGDREAALAQAEAFRHGGALGDYHRLRRELAAGAGRFDDAAAEAWAWASARPDEPEAVAALFLPETRQRLGRGRVFAFLHDVVRRRPDDPDRLLAALERHAGAGGSPAVALALAHALDRLDPDDPRVRRAREVRAEVLAGLTRLGRLVDVDLDAARLTLERTDGLPLVIDADPASGLPLRWREGAAWTAARWDTAGRLLTLSDGAGGAVSLAWDGDGRLTSIEGRGSAPFQAELAADGTVRHLAGSEAAYNATLPVLAAWQAGEPGSLPELPHKDAELDRRLAAETGDLRTRLAVAARLVERLGDRRDHAAQARARLEPLLDQARLRDPAIGLEAATLWHRLALAVFPDGLSQEAWRRWVAVRGWVAVIEAGKDGALAARRDALRAAFAARPLALAAQARWLAGSYLGNPANWRLYPAEDVLAAAGTPSHALVARAGGDVVLGSDVGLSVLRQGRWTRYAFDAGSGRLVAEDIGEAGPAVAAPGITSMAEDTGGALWLVAGDRLVRLAGPYDGMAESWPTGRIDGLAAFGQGVVAATPAGLIRFDAGGPAPLPEGLRALGAAPVRFIVDATAPDEAEPMLLAATPQALMGWSGGALRVLLPGTIEAARRLPAIGRVAVLQDGGLLTLPWRGRGEAGPPEPVATAAELNGLGRTLGLASLPFDDGSPVIVVLGERGLALARDGHAEIRHLPGPVPAFATAGTEAWAATAAGVFAVGRGIMLRE